MPEDISTVRGGDRVDRRRLYHLAEGLLSANVQERSPAPPRPWRIQWSAGTDLFPLSKEPRAAASASAAIISPCGRTTQREHSGRIFPVLATSFLHRRPAGTLKLLFRGDAVETAKLHHELVLVVSLALARRCRGAAEARGPHGAALAVRRRRAAVQRGPFSSRRSRAASRTRTHFEPRHAYARPTTSIRAGPPAP